MATGPIETHLHCTFNWENGAPGPQEGPRGRSANCGNGLFAQCVRLRSEINRRQHSRYGRHAYRHVQDGCKNARACYPYFRAVTQSHLFFLRICTS